MSDGRNLLSTYMLLGELMREREEAARQPRPASLELMQDGWQVWDGKSDKPIPVHVDHAYEIAERSSPGGGQPVLDETRKLCGTLRFRGQAEQAQGAATR